jgi:hypothetical protein
VRKRWQLLLHRIAATGRRSQRPMGNAERLRPGSLLNYLSLATALAAA